jgi:hypothetical protein
VLVLVDPRPRGVQSPDHNDKDDSRRVDLHARVDDISQKSKLAVKLSPSAAWAGTFGALDAGPYLLRLSKEETASYRRTSTFNEEFGIPLWVADGFRNCGRSCTSR